ncbi:MAG: restriction endonuclease subunit S [Colwellia sp.]|nr:restriction endonuclease subunit S [Colwellia sp.]
MKSDWAPCFLAEIVDIHTDKVSVDDVKLGDYISTDSMLPDFGGITSAVKMPLSGKVTSFHKGDVLFSNIRTYFKKLWLANKSGACSNDVIVFCPKEGIESHYVFHFLMNENFIKYTIKTSKGTKMPRGDKDAILKYEFPLAPRKQRKLIGDYLISFKNRILLNHQTNQTLEQMAQALFKSWFVDFDPVIDNALDAGTQVNDFPEALQHRALLRKDSRKQAELLNEYKPLPDDIRALFPSEFEQTDEPSIGIGGCIPKGWKVSNVGTGFNVTMGQSPPSSTYNEMGNGMPFYQGKTDFGFRFPCYRIFCTAPKRLANEGDTLVSVRAPVGDVNLAKDNCAIGRGIAAVRHKIGAISFTYYSLKELERYFKRYEGEGTVFGSINQKDFNKLPFIIPSDEIIKSFEKIASSLDEKLALNAQNISELEKLRDTLLPKLISGELQIPEEKATNKDVV